MNLRSPRNLSAFKARLEGRVQGVGFRYCCMTEGRRLGLGGWVRNLPDGDVEVLAEGSKETLEEFLQWLRQGPPGAQVDNVHYETLPPAGEYRNFIISR